MLFCDDFLYSFIFARFTYIVAFSYKEWMLTFIAFCCVDLPIFIYPFYYFFIYISFKKIIYLFKFFFAALGLCCCTWAFFSCTEQGLLFVAVRGLLIAVASLVA